jgi:hypothetical protein
VYITKSGAEAMAEGAPAHCQAHTSWFSLEFLTKDTLKLRPRRGCFYTNSPPGSFQYSTQVLPLGVTVVVLTAMADVNSDNCACMRSDIRAY